jgi:Flp pilus assembly protein TadG
VEIALVLILFYAFLFGIVYASFLIFAWNNTAFAARGATRYAMVHGASSGYACTASDIQALVRKTPGLQSATVTTTWTPNNSAGSTIKVFVSLPVSVMVPLTTLKTITVASSSQMTIIQ